MRNLAAGKVIGQVLNVARSLPFIIWTVALTNLTRTITGTTIGREAAISAPSPGVDPMVWFRAHILHAGQFSGP